jgi:hypothetical protein
LEVLTAPRIPGLQICDRKCSYLNINVSKTLLSKEKEKEKEIALLFAEK